MPTVALVHDYLVDAGGAERVVMVLSQTFPEAPLHTSIYDVHNTDPGISPMRVRTSFLQRVYPGKRYYQVLLPLFLLAFRRTRPTAEVVISSASAFAKAVTVAPSSVHICYCHTPPRFAWRAGAYSQQQGWGPFRGAALASAATVLRRWDRSAANGVHYFISNSSVVANRIKMAYERDAAVIPPPIDLNRFRWNQSGTQPSYFLTASRLIAYKRIDLPVVACTELGLPLKVVGTGPDLARLRRLAGPTVEFLGRVTDERLAQLYTGCIAVIQPGEEDFGLTPLEANATGRPVIAYGAGGALDTVHDGDTGLLFLDHSVQGLIEALCRVQHMTFDAQRLRRHALGYSAWGFQRRMRAFTEFAWERGRPTDDTWLVDWLRLDATLVAEIQAEAARQADADVRK